MFGLSNKEKAKKAFDSLKANRDTLSAHEGLMLARLEDGYRSSGNNDLFLIQNLMLMNMMMNSGNSHSYDSSPSHDFSHHHSSHSFDSGSSSSYDSGSSSYDSGSSGDSGGGGGCD